jgi:glutathione-independent formaldehyde dehydrogenase
MSKNRGVVYVKPGVVEDRDIADPKFEDPRGRKINHAVILKIISTNICGSDQHMVRGRTSAPAGLVLGHEITPAWLRLLYFEFEVPKASR